MIGFAQMTQRRRVFALRNTERAAGSRAAREGQFRSEFDAWLLAHPDAGYGERDFQERVLRNKFRL